jgi:hypothetical protein
MVRCVCVIRRQFSLFDRSSVAPFVDSLATLVRQLTSATRTSLLRRSSLTAFAQSIYSKETLDSSGEAARFGVADVSQ